MTNGYAQFSLAGIPTDGTTQTISGIFAAATEVLGTNKPVLLCDIENMSPCFAQAFVNTNAYFITNLFTAEITPDDEITINSN